MLRLTALAAVCIIALPAFAQEPLTTKRKDAKGRPVTVTLTGSYQDCVRDGQKMGYSRDAAIRYCNSRPGLKK